jgi:hypothetical protein
LGRRRLYFIKYGIVCKVDFSRDVIVIATMTPRKSFAKNRT